MSAWLVTGGAGFIGSNFVRMAAERSSGHVVVLDSLTYAGNLAGIGDLVDAGDVSFVHGDVCDSGVVSGLFERYDFDVVVHFAAESHVDRSILGPREFVRTNVEGTFQLLEAARRTWRPESEGRRFLQISTDEVFGSLQPDDVPFTESSPYRPNSPYAASKAAADHLARAWFRTYGLPVIVTNCSNNYGPWQFPEKLIPLVIANVMEGRELPVYGDGLQIRDWLHVRDHCEALHRVIEAGRAGETYLIGGSNECTNIDLVRRLCAVVDQKLGRESGASAELIRIVTDRPGHDRRYAIDASKIRSELGWQPSLQFDNSLADLVDWYLEHRTWMDEIRSGEYRNYYAAQYGARA